LLVFVRVFIRTQIRTRRPKLGRSQVARGIDFQQSNGPKSWYASRTLRNPRPARRGRLRR
jgi:hypothetical protein